MKNIRTFVSFLTIALIFSVITVDCHRDTLTEKDIKVNPKNGFAVTHTFENGIWTFPKVDDGIDKELHLTGTFPNPQEFYKLMVIVDFYGDVQAKSLPLVITTTSPDGNSMQSTNVLVEFNDEETVTELGEENAKKLLRATKVIYPSKQFAEEGTYHFTVYSKYSKMSLQGVKSLTIAAQKVEK